MIYKGHEFQIVSGINQNDLTKTKKLNKRGDEYFYIKEKREVMSVVWAYFMRKKVFKTEFSSWGESILRLGPRGTFYKNFTLYRFGTPEEARSAFIEELDLRDKIKNYKPKVLD